MSVLSAVSKKITDTRVGLREGYQEEGYKAFFKRGPWEMVATITIGLGVFMLMQPFALWLYTYSLITILAGTIGFLIVSHFPE